MEAPPNLNATAEPIESNENKTSCRANPRQLHLRSTEIPGSTRGSRVGLKARPLLRIRYGGGSPKRTFVNSAINA